MAIHRFIGPLAAAVLVLGGCEGREHAPPIEETERLEAEGEAGGAQAPESLESADEADLAATPGVLASIDRSGVHGRAEIIRDGGDRVVVEVEAEGLEQGTRYAAAVHEGRCALGGPVRRALGEILADAEGRGSIRTEVARDRLPESDALFVQLHDREDEAVACANLQVGGES